MKAGFSVWHRCFAAALLALMFLSSCASKDPAAQPIMYPYFAAADDDAQSLSCQQLDTALRKTDSIRWSMRMDGKAAETTTETILKSVMGAGLAAACFVFDPVNSSMLGVASVARPFVDDIVTAADFRLISLLQIKVEKSCPALPSGHTGLTDLDVLREVEQLEQLYAVGEVSEEAYVSDRSRWLDSLYPTVSAVVSQPSANAPKKGSLDQPPAESG